MRAWGRWTLVALAPLCGAWQGAGNGLIGWAAGVAKRAGEETTVPLDVVVRVDPDQGVHLVATLELPGPGGDGVLGLRLDRAAAAERSLELPDPRVEVTYTEYTSDGRIAFEAARVTAGRLRAKGMRFEEIDLRLELDLEAPGPTGRRWRRLADTDVIVRPVVVEVDDTSPAAGAGGEPPVEAVGGCEGNSYDDDPYDDAEHDWESGSPSSSGGCEGDDLGSSDGADTWSDDGGGCEGDDVGGSSDAGEGCDGACAGDAMAAGPGARRPRRVWAARVVGWLPWLMVFAALRLARRRAR